MIAGRKYLRNVVNMLLCLSEQVFLLHPQLLLVSQLTAMTGQAWHMWVCF
jgi:hypothetical protein